MTKRDGVDDTRRVAALVAPLMVAGVVFLAWFVASPLGIADGDEAVVGLMARDMLHGHFRAFFWGQAYGGTQEAALIALLLALRIPGRWAIEAVPIGLHSAAAVLVWRIGLRTVGTRAASLAAATFWAASPPMLWWATKERGFYGVTLVAGLAVVLLALRLADQAEGESVPRVLMRDAFLLGVFGGVGWWASPQALYLTAPSLLWLAFTLRHELRRVAQIAGLSLGGALAGAFPWIWANAGSSFGSLRALPGSRVTLGNPWYIFFHYGLPMLLGLRAPITLGWQIPLGRVVYAAFLLLIIVLVITRPRPLRLVLFAALAAPLVFALLPTTYYFGEPRYLTFLWPLLALIIGWLITKLRWLPLEALAVVCVLALTSLGVNRMTQLVNRAPALAYEDMSPHPVSSVVRVLNQHRIDRVFADYWVGYRTSWATDERIVAAPVQVVRSPAYERAVESVASPAYVLVRESCIEIQFHKALEQRNIAYEDWNAGYWVVVQPATRILPADALPDWATDRGIYAPQHVC